MTRSMLLGELLPALEGLSADLAITGLVPDSREVAPGNAFVAIAGVGAHGLHFVDAARDAGAAKVYMASAAPPVRYPNVYGIDMPTSNELVAHNRTVEEIRQIIGCDALIYQDVDAMKKAVHALNPQLGGFDASCFDGVYCTGDITPADIERLNEKRLDTSESQVDTSRLALPNAQEA